MNGSLAKPELSSVSTLEGTVRRLGLEGGLWALVTDEGTTVELVDPPEGLLRDGARARVEIGDARVEVSVGMVGRPVQVRSFRLL